MTLVALLLASAAFAQEPAPKPNHVTDPRSGVPIVLAVEEGMFPESWLGSDINAKATSLDPAQADRSVKLVEQALAKYPVEFLKKELKKVYVCQSIQFYGLQYGGTNSLDTVYLTNQGPGKGYNDAYITGSFHHEFSSILLRNHAAEFDDSAWKSANAKGFKYGQGGTAALRNGQASTKYDPTLASSGFLTQYSQASVEEDFNMIVEGMFSGDKEFWALVDKHSRIKDKVALAVKLYSGFDKQFSEGFFRALVKPD